MLKKISLIILVLCISLALITSCTTPSPTSQPTSTPTDLPVGEPVKLGMGNPMSGPCAPIGKVFADGMQVWADVVNENGGIVVEGERHMVDYRVYDNVCWVPSEHRTAYEKMILQDGVKFSVQSWGDAMLRAIKDVVQENEHLAFVWGSGWLHPDYPYLMGTMTGGPDYIIAVVKHWQDQNPGKKRLALLMADNPQSLTESWYVEIASKVMGFEIVYNKFHPEDTVDYMPVMQAILDTNPDAIFMGSSEGWQGLAGEAARDLGYTGDWITEALYKQEYSEDVWNDYMSSLNVYSTYANYASDPKGLLPPVTKEIYQEFQSRFPDQWVTPCSESIEAAEFFKYAVETANSLDPEVVMTKMYAMDLVEHPVWGPSVWGGEGRFGAKHHLITPVGVNKLINGVQTTDALFDMASWVDEHADVMEEVLSREGLWYQG